MIMSRWRRRQKFPSQLRKGNCSLESVQKTMIKTEANIKTAIAPLAMADFL